MKIFTILAFCAILGFLLFYSLPKKEPSLSMCVSIAPLEYFAERIVSHTWEILALVHAGQNHETYELSPQEVFFLMHMRLYFSTDFPFERGWFEKVRKMNPRAEIVELPREIFPYGATNDFHIWTSPRLAEKIAFVMLQKIVDIDPVHQSLYQKGYKALLLDLQKLDREIGEMLALYRGKKFYVYHPAWNYFAQDYGLEEIAIEKEGKEPTLQQLVLLIEQAKKDGVKVIFLQKGMNRKNSELIARAVGGRVEEIDPLEKDYISNMRNVAKQLQKAFEDEKTSH